MSVAEYEETVTQVGSDDFVAFLKVAEDAGQADEFSDLWFGSYGDKYQWESEAHWALVEMLTAYSKDRPDLRKRLDRIGWDYPPGDFTSKSDPAPSHHQVEVEPVAAKESAIASSEPRRTSGVSPARSQRVCRPRSAAELLAMHFPDPAWAVHGLLPEGLSILAGKPKLGKSWLALQLAVAVASGTPILGDRRVEQGAVLYLALEDTDRRLQSRMEKVLGGSAAPPGFFYENWWERMNLGGASELKRWLASQEKPRLVIVDTLACARSVSAPTGSQYEDDYRATQEFKQIADEFGIAVLLVHHVRKMGAEDPFDTVAGTVGLTGAADAILLLQRERNRNYGKLAVTGRDVEELALDLQWNPEAGLWTVTDGPVEPQISDERRGILEILAGATAPMGPKEVASALDRDYERVRQRMWQMAKDGQLVHISRKYALPDNADNVTNAVGSVCLDNISPALDEIEEFEELELA